MYKIELKLVKSPAPMNVYFLFFILLVSSLHPFAIVFIYLGGGLPKHLGATLDQARLFHPTAPIYLIATQKALTCHPFLHDLIPIPCESLSLSSAYRQFAHTSKQHFLTSLISPKDLLCYSAERFFYLEALMREKNLSDVICLGNEELLYTDLEEYLPFFQAHYPNKIGAAFENDSRAAPALLYIPNLEQVSQLTQFMKDRAHLGESDALLLGNFKQASNQKWVDLLPTIPPEFIEDHFPLESTSGIRSQQSNLYANHFDKFQSLFDGISFGICMGGDDAMSHCSDPGRINPLSVFDLTDVKIEWTRDEKKREIPVLLYKEKKYKINNLHIRNKSLVPSFTQEKFKSSQVKQLSQKKEGKLLKTTYNFSDEPIDVVIPCSTKDLETLELAIDGIKKYGHNIRRIIVVSKKQLTTKAEWFDENLYPFSKEELALEIFRANGEEAEKKAEQVLLSPHSRIGWLYQQLIKLYAPFVIPDISSNILVLDADVIFLKSVSFQSPKTLGPLFAYGHEYQPFYFTHAEKLIPGLYRLYYEYSGIAHHMLFQRPIVEDLFAHIRDAHHVEPWQAFCRCINPSMIYGSFCSEYEIYFNFALLRTEQAEVRPLRWINAQDLSLKLFQKQDYDYVACHTWWRSMAIP